MSDAARSSSPFNSALETGVRALWVLSEASPSAFDLQRLVYFDYLVVHSADAAGPPSLHPRTPLRNGELLVRRGLIERGLLLMISRGLVQRSFDRRGISFTATEDAGPFLECLTSDYAKALRDRAEWAVRRFGGLSEGDFRRFVDTNFERWSREFQSTGDRLPDLFAL
jgi:hypothetical protein